MKQALLIFVFCTSLYSQYDNSLVGSYQQNSYENGILNTRTVVWPKINDKNYKSEQIVPIIHPLSPQSNSGLRWVLFDALAIANNGQEAGNGLYSAVGWQFNQPQRVSLYNNASGTLIWDHITFASNSYYNYVTISDDGEYLASGSYHNIFAYGRASSTPVLNFNLETQLPDTGSAGPIGITANGSFVVASVVRTDSSTVIGFNRTSSTPVWRFRASTGIQGVRISRNDSLVIVNTYSNFWVLRTYTGAMVYSGLINGGTQTNQGISGDGSIIGIINYSGLLRVFQWNGTTYNLLWQNQEPPGINDSWITAVDISNDGSLVACGTWNFPASYSFDGKIKLFRTASGSTPVWTFAGAGNRITCVSLSRNSNILSACTWGDMNNNLPDLYVFKLSTGNNAPIYTLNTPGSLYWCSTSNDGSTVQTGGKIVHAQTSGYGGETYNIFIDTNDSPLGIISNNQIPDRFELEQNFPNPFNPQTQIIYSLGENGPVSIVVYDVLGREVATLINKVQPKGKYSITFDGSDLPSGVYFYKMVTASINISKKMILAK